MDLDEFQTCVAEADSEEEIEACIDRLPSKEYRWKITYRRPGAEIKTPEDFESKAHYLKWFARNEPFETRRGKAELGEIVDKAEMMASDETPLVSVEVEEAKRELPEEIEEMAERKAKEKVMEEIAEKGLRKTLGR